MGLVGWLLSACNALYPSIKAHLILILDNGQSLPFCINFKLHVFAGSTISTKPGQVLNTDVNGFQVFKRCQYDIKFMPLLVCLQIAAVRHAKEKGVAVSHTLLDNVRACSSTPDAAVAFFCAVLNPSPTARLSSTQALHHPYLRCAVHQMQASYQSPTTPASGMPSRSDSCTQGTDILGRLASVPSYGFRTMKSLVSQALLGNHSSSGKAHMRDMARYFPDYVHPSSDAELSAFQPHTPNHAAMPPKETPANTDVRQLMAGMNQLRADFNLKSPPATPASPVAAAPPELHPILHAKAPPNTDSAAAVLHAKSPPNTDSAAAALHLQRQLYPASPLSAAGSGFIPALHSAYVQPFGSCEGGSDAASGQRHRGTPAQVADESIHSSPDTDMHEAQLNSPQATRSSLHTVQGQDASAEDCATAGSGSCQGGSDAASGQQPLGTPAQVADESMHNPPNASVDEPQLSSTPASSSILHAAEGPDASAEDCATAGSHEPEGGSHAASSQQPLGTPAQVADESIHSPPDTIMHEPQLSSTQASRSILHTMAGRDTEDCATAGSADSAAQPPAAVSATSQEQEEGRQSKQTAFLIGGSVRDAMEQRHSEMQQMPMTEAEAEQASCLLTADAVRDSGETAVRDSGDRAAAVGNLGDSAAAVGDSGDSAAAVGGSGDSAAAVTGSVYDTLVTQDTFVNHATHEGQLRSYPVDIEPEEEEVMAGAQPNQSLQSPSLDSPAHVQLPNQQSGTLKNAEGTDATASEEYLKSHALHFCHGFDNDLDVLDPSANVQLSNQHLGALKNAEHVAATASEEPLQSHALHFCPSLDDDLDVLGPCNVADAGACSNHNCPGMQDAHCDPDPYPYLDENAPLQQAPPAQVPLYRSVAIAAYVTCSSLAL